MQPDLNTLPPDTVPAVREAISELPALEAMAVGYSIKTVEQYAAGLEDLKRVKAAQKRVEDTRLGITGPMNAALKKVNDFFREPALKLQRVEVAIKGEAVRYADEQARIAREEQRKADEKAEKERQRLAAQAAKATAAGKEGKAEQLTERAAQVVAPIIQREPPKIAGVNYRMVTKFAIEDASKLPELYKMPDEKKIGAQVKALGMDANIPGVRVWQEKQIAAGSM